MDPFHSCLAMGPLAIYLLVLGALNLSRRAMLVSGTRDAAALGLALSGLAICGPIKLFFPEGMVARFGLQAGQAMAAYAALYALALVLILLTLRPRLVIYNIGADQLRPILAEVVERLDRSARWAGDSLALPSLGVQLHLENLASMRNISLVSSGPNQDPAGWRQLEKSLAAVLAQMRVGTNPRGVTLLSTGVCIVGVLVFVIVRDPQAIAHGLLDMLHW